MDYNKILKEHVKNIEKLESLGFTLSYCGEEEPFFIMFNKARVTICSVQIISSASPKQYYIKFELASPYLEHNKTIINDLYAIGRTMNNMTTLPIRDLHIDNLPIISDFEISTIKPQKSFTEYFHLDSYQYMMRLTKNLYYEEPSIEEGFDSANMKNKYDHYVIENLALQTHYKKADRLNQLPKQIQAIVIDDYEQENIKDTLENRMPKYRKFLSKI